MNLTNIELLTIKRSLSFQIQEYNQVLKQLNKEGKGTGSNWHKYTQNCINLSQRLDKEIIKRS